MRIENIRSEALGTTSRVTATVTWEDCDRPPLDLYFETTAEFAADLQPNPNAFLIAATLPAMHHGEKRVFIEGPVCPQVHHGLDTTMQIIRAWYGPPRKPVQIESAHGFKPPMPLTKTRVSFFFSGGVDSMATLRVNRLDFPLDHPGSIKDGILVHGFDIGAYTAHSPRFDVFEDALAKLQHVSREADLNLIPVYTNTRHLCENGDFWIKEFFGAALTAVAHCFSTRLTDILLASSASCTENTKLPFGSHPMLDFNYSSAALRIHHDCLCYSRYEKTRIVADWQTGLDNLRVCPNTRIPQGQLNCGHCAKCIRTMVQLFVLKKLQTCKAFPSGDLTPQLLRTVGFKPWDIEFFEPMIEPLSAMGRNDLADVIVGKISELHRYQYWTQERGFKGAIRRFDRTHLSGTFTKLIRSIY